MLRIISVKSDESIDMLDIRIDYRRNKFILHKMKHADQLLERLVDGQEALIEALQFIYVCKDIMDRYALDEEYR